MNYCPYTYLIGWSAHDTWYYGVQYGLKPIANPQNLWKTYFTSCRRVIEFRQQYGEPDIIQIRKVFSTRQAAIDWEGTVLHRLKVASNPKWLNRNVRGGIFLTTEEHSARTKKAAETRKANGHIPWNKGKKGSGKKWTEEEKTARSKAYKGRLIPRERAERSAAGLRGKRKSDEHKRRLSLSSATEDHTIYNFKDIISGKDFVGTRRQFTEQYYPDKTSMSSHLNMFVSRKTNKLFKRWLFVSSLPNHPKLVSEYVS